MPLKTSPQPSEEVVIPVETASLLNAVSGLLRGSSSDLDAYLHLLDRRVNLDGRKVNIHCHSLLCNQQGPRVNDFARLIAARIVDYAIPRKEFIRAKLESTYLTRLNYFGLSQWCKIKGHGITNNKEDNIKALEISTTELLEPVRESLVVCSSVQQGMLNEKRELHNLNGEIHLEALRMGMIPQIKKI